MSKEGDIEQDVITDSSVTSPASGTVGGTSVEKIPPDAAAPPPPTTATRNNKMLMIIGIVILGLIALGVGLGLKKEEEEAEETLWASGGDGQVHADDSSMVPCSEDPECQLVMDGLGPVIPPGAPDTGTVPPDDTCHAEVRDWLHIKVVSLLEDGTEQLQQRYALGLLYCELDGPNWIQDHMWLSDSHECDWYNVICNEDNQIVALNLQGNHLHGTLPMELFTLSQLETLSLSNNLIHGTLPSEYARFSNLQQFNISHNLFQGPLPGYMYRYPYMRQLDISYNQFVGSVPNDVHVRMPELETLQLQNNNLYGTIPETLGQLNLLTTLALSNNELMGTIPSSLFQTTQDENGTITTTATSLEELFLHGNYLNGTIPFEDMILSTNVKAMTFHYNPDLSGSVLFSNNTNNNNEVIQNNNTNTSSTFSTFCYDLESIRMEQQQQAIETNEEEWMDGITNTTTNSTTVLPMMNTTTISNSSNLPLLFISVDCSNVLCDCCVCGSPFE